VAEGGKGMLGVLHALRSDPRALIPASPLCWPAQLLRQKRKM